MNTNHIKYVQTIAKCGSIHKASKELFISQPHLTNIICKLEEEFGITLFKRSCKGVVLTDEGNEFLIHTSPILTQSEHIKNIFNPSSSSGTRYFSLSTQRFQLALDAFLELEEIYKDESTQFSYKESSVFDIINDVCINRSDIGIFTTSNIQEKLFIKILNSKNINVQYIDLKAGPCAIVHKNNPLSSLDEISIEELKNYTYVSYGDDTMYDINFFAEYQAIGLNKVHKSIKIYDRYSLGDILSKRNYYTVGMDTEQKNKDFVCIPIKDTPITFIGVIIYNNAQTLSEESRKFLEIIDSYTFQVIND